VILVDSNVPMYLVGADHPHKTAAAAAVRRLTIGGRKLVTDAEVFQELLHRYAAIGRRDMIPKAFDALRGIAETVLPITLEDALDAKEVALVHTDLSARDALHVAVMRRHGIEEILSYDTGFDRVPGIRRTR